jgi:hypothetical protein
MFARKVPGELVIDPACCFSRMSDTIMTDNSAHSTGSGHGVLPERFQRNWP